MTGIECLLGARAEYDGLAIEPRLPQKWKQARIVRPFRGATYDIRIRRKAGTAHMITVDGRSQKGNLIPVFGDGRTHAVEVVIP